MTSIRDVASRAQQTLTHAVDSVETTAKAEVAKVANAQGQVKDAFDKLPQTAQSLGNTVAHLPNVAANLGWGESTSSAHRAGWVTQQDPTPTTDVTAEFKKLNSAAGSGKDVLPKDAGNYKYLVIGGLFGKHLPGYMDDNVAGLKSHGLDASEVPVDSDAAVTVNAETIRKAIEAAHAEGKQVVIIAHSKGGVDAAAALSMHPELKNDVRAMVAIQSPFGGSPVAQDLENPATAPVVNNLVKALLHGDPASVKDLTYDARQKFLAQHPLPTDVPTISVATSRDSLGSVLLGSEEYMKNRYGYPSDGLVVPADAIMPGSHVVRLTDMDHAESSLRGVPGFANYRPADITQALVAMALEMPARTPTA